MQYECGQNIKNKIFNLIFVKYQGDETDVMIKFGCVAIMCHFVERSDF